jgi:hypothetical protein
MNDAGNLFGRIAVWRVGREADEVLYRALRDGWSEPKQTGKMTVFAKSGVGGDEWEFTIREGDLQPGDLIVWRKGTFLVLNIRETGRHPVWLEIKAVKLRLLRGKLSRTVPEKNERGVTVHRMKQIELVNLFMTEKYIGEAAEQNHQTTKTQMIAELPRESDALPGDILEIEGQSWRVMTIRDLSPYKKDLEIELISDV